MHRFPGSFWLLTGGFALGLLITLSLGIGMKVLDTKASSQVLMAAFGNRIQEEAANTPGVARTGEVMVPLHQDERALMLNATLDHRHTAPFILDTGATYTAISAELATQLGYDLRKAPKVQITTANGQVLLPKVKIRALTLNGYTAYNVEATVMPLPKNVPFSGLLGLSFVKNHRITIDSRADRLVIQPLGG